MIDEKNEKIKEHWQEKAEQWGQGWQATLGERWLRMLEIKTIAKKIERYSPRQVLDVGCGNGFSTKKYARKFPGIEFVGLDYSPKMISQANKDTVKNCSFMEGNVLELGSFPKGEFDMIITQRCIQNLSDYESQAIAIKNLLTKKSSKGTLLLMECSKDGLVQLNNMRMKLRLKPKENIMPWHNNFRN